MKTEPLPSLLAACCLALAFVAHSARAAAIDDGPGSRVQVFAPELGGDPIVYVDQLVLGPDGDLFVAGTFTSVNGLPRNHLARLNPDGSLDEHFQPQSPVVSWISEIAVDPAARVLVNGTLVDTNFDWLQVLQRTLADGSIDTNFNVGPIQNGAVQTLARDLAGRWLIGGQFTAIGGIQRAGFARLGADGMVDASFNPALGVEAGPITSPWVSLVLVQPNQKIIIIGYFSSVNGVSRSGLARLNTDGSLDENFEVTALGDFGVRTAIIQPDGKLLLAVSTYDGQFESDSELMRLNADGSVDSSFTPVSPRPPPNWPVVATISFLGMQPNGQIIVAGSFGSLNGLPRRDVGRLNSDGSLDPSFDVGGGWDDMDIRTFAVDAAGDVLLGGHFSLRDTGASSSLVRLRGSNSNFLGRFEFSAAALSVWETNGAAALTIRRDGGAPAPASVRLTASGGTASNGLDFVFAPATVAFAEGETSKTIVIEIVRDALIEPPEDIVFTLSDPVGAYLGSQITEQVTILDHPGGLLDVTYGHGLGQDEWIASMILLPGERILATGLGLMVINSDGSRDGRFVRADFAAGTPIGASGDGKIYACRAGGGLARMLPDGSMDAAFQPQLALCPFAITVQTDGKPVFSWQVNQINAPVYSNRLARLNLDGSVDTTFNQELGVDGRVSRLVMQPDGKILLGGTFSSIGGVARSNLARLNADGAVDLMFAPSVRGGALSEIVLQPDGRLLLGGSFTNINGVFRQGLARLNLDGSLDASFTPPVNLDLNVTISAIALQGDGRILVGGSALPLHGRPGGLLRLQMNGAADPTFDPDFGLGGAVQSLIVQADGKVIAGGTFLARLLNDDGVGAGRIEFTAPFTQVNEAAPSVTVTVRRTAGSRGAVTVGYGAAGGTATDGADFSAPQGRIRFEDGETSEKTITVPLHDDLLAEGSEILFVYLANPIGGATFGPPAMVTLLDDDTELEFVETDLRVSENEPLKLVAVRRIGGSNGVVSVHFTTHDGTAQAGLDYLAQDGTLTFADGETLKSFALPILDDEEAEADEVINLVLSEPGGGARLGPNTMAEVTILDDDRPGTADHRFDASADLGSFYYTSPRFGSFPVELAEINALAVQPDGRILVGGLFADTTHTNASGLVRLMPNGALDWSFAPSGSSNGNPVVTHARVLALQPDGKMLVASTFPALYRLQANGWLDQSFHSTIVGDSIETIVIQPDGRILISGSFTTVNGSPRSGIARLQPDGSLDSTFDPGTGVVLGLEGEEPRPGLVKAMVLVSGGRIVLGGRFDAVNGQARSGLVRLMASGALDPTFGIGNGVTNDLSELGPAFVSALATGPDDRLLVAGCFTQANGIARTNFVQLQSDGAVDLAFASPIFPCFIQSFETIAPVLTMLVQPDGRILIGGTLCMESACAELLRLNPNGSLDETFTSAAESLPSFGFLPGSLSAVRAIAMQSDGQVLIGGTFSALDGQAVPGLARLNGGVARFEFHSLARVGGALVRLNFAMPRGQDHLLQASADLVHWSDLNLGRPIRDQSQFIDSTAVGAEWRFYRARKSP